MSSSETLSRRERQIVDVVVRLGEATVAQVLENLRDPPSYSAVRTTMGILVDKGHLQFKQVGRRYLYRPAQSRHHLRKKALKDVVSTFFENSAEQLVETLLDPSSKKLESSELDRIAEIVERAREKRK